MARSNSYERWGEPRSAPDDLAEPYARMVAQQRAYNERQEAEAAKREAERKREPRSPERRIDHPGTLESMIPVWGSGKEALADLEDGNYVGFGVNAALAASDVVLAKALVSGVIKGGVKTAGLKMAGPHAWRTGPPRTDAGMRKWLGDKKFAKPGQPMHHWWLEQKSKAPDWLKNQPPFLKPMKDAVQHGRIHGRYTVDGVKLPQFNRYERLWHGTPDWLKAGYVSSAGHAGTATGKAIGPEPYATSPRPRRP